MWLTKAHTSQEAPTSISGSSSLLLFSLFSIFNYGANSVNEAEVNKYIREKLDRDKTITFTTKLTEPLTTARVASVLA